MSNEMISVPRADLALALGTQEEGVTPYLQKRGSDRLRALLAKPAEQRQGEPVELPVMPEMVDRRPGWPEGYLESDNDWCDNNPEAVGWLADNHAAIRAALYTRPAEQPAPVALHIPDECPHMIVFDDTDRENMLFAGTGARSAALKTWEKISMSWNAHLFVRVDRNSRDDRYPSAKPSPVAVVPEGYCIMPRRLTAENGAKALLLGEFKLQSTHECPECRELEEPSEGCEICDGEGEYGQKHTIPWDLIKFIYSKAVEGLAIQPATDSSTSDKYKATLKDARAMLATVAECVTNECEDCKEHAQLKCAAIDGVLNSHTEGQSSAANDRWYAAEDVDRLVRELDVLINGEEGAAAQAKLCDIVAQVRRLEGSPVVWLDPTSGRKANTISNALKCYNESKGGAPAVAAALYTVPLYARLAIVKG